MSQIKYWLQGILLSGVFLVSNKSNAQSDPVLIQALDGATGNFKVDSFVTVQDTKWWTPTERAKIDTTLPRKTLNLITLKINEESGTYIRSNFTTQVAIRIYYTSKDSLTDSTNYTFEINYDTAGGAKYNNRRLYTFNNGYKVTTKILSITTTFPAGVTSWNVIPLLRLENEMQIYRYYNFTCASFPASFYSNVPSTDLGQLSVYYSKIDGATEYDFEWTFIDSIALRDTSLYGDFTNPDPARIFDAGATRITTTDVMYAIPLLFDNSGYIFSRVRAVKVLSDGQRIEGKWCTDKTPALMDRYYFAGHERKLNWQATTSFAEDGKRKSVVQYADGSLRARQTVTKDNASQNILIAETLYDYQGRPTIQVLPAPNLSNLIGYVYDFNKSVSGSEYEKSSYDSLINYCNGGAPAMSQTGSGASYYYSPNFAYANMFNSHKALAQAYGYAFAETRYSQDNTGRISSQGGVGDQYQIGGGHETKYFYGKPDPKELNVLFGTEAGDASHYQKNMVRDANGQYSVSYVDMHGRTVATALAGKPTSKLDTLESYNRRIITKTLSDPQATVLNGMSMNSSTGLLITKAGTNTFHYTLQPDSLRMKACDSSQICYDCVYNLEISISDDCNNQQLPDQTLFVLLDSNFTIGHFDTTCGNAIPNIDTTFSLYLTEGSYNISKKLSVSRPGFEYYRDSVFLKKNLCKTFQDFYNEALIANQNSDCEPSCSSCLAQLGTYEQFRHNYMQQNGVDSATQLSQYESQIQSAYQTAKAGCDILCDSVTVLTDIREMMLADMTPECGQYANPDIFETGYEHNIFHKQGSSASYNFQNIGTSYYVDENGKRDSILNSSGQLVPPSDVTIAQDQFIAQYKPSWAPTLLPQHPEYACLVNAEQLRLSYIWDANFENTNTYAEAKAKGYLNPVGLTGYGFLPSVSGGTDPLSTLNSSLYNNLKSKAQNYKQNGATQYSMWAIATATAHCNQGEQTCFTTYLSLSNAFDSTVLCRGELDMAWRSFQQMYLAEKRIIINNYLLSLNSLSQGIPSKYYRHFQDVTSITNNLTLTYTGDSATVVGIINDSINNHYASNCIAYAASWWSQLATCNFSYNDSLIIMPRLIRVCEQGSDPRHPLGSSTIGPKSIDTLVSFDDVIKSFLDSAGRTYNENCNGFLISGPKPYEHPATYASMPLWTKPDSCQCGRITDLHNQFLAGGAGDANFSAYVKRTTNADMAEDDLQQILQMCGGRSSCKFLEKPIKIPAVLQCGISAACLGCDSLSAFNGRFITRFGISPQKTDTDSLQIRRNKLYANYMNFYTGFNKSHAEYLDFLDSCHIYDSIPTTCDTLRQILADFRTNYYYMHSPTPGYNADGCDTTTVGISQNTAYTNRWVRFRDLFEGGVLHVPDSVYSHVTASLHVPTASLEWGDSAMVKQFNYSAIRSPGLCNLNNKFTWKLRLKAKHFLSEATGSSYTGPLFILRNSSFDINIYTFRDFPAPIIINGNSGSGDLSALQLEFKDWSEVTIKAEDNKIKFYVDGVFKAERAYTGTINNLDELVVQNSWVEGWIDYSTIYDGNGRVILSEDFSNACGSFGVVNPAFDCGKLGCDSAFKSYFNTARGTSYTYSQIQQQYLTNCSRPALPCQPYDDEPKLCTDGDIFPEIEIPDQGPCSDSSTLAFQIATEKYNAYKDSLNNAFENAYLAKCMKAYQYEQFTVTDSVSEFHYTLYYYDQAGNLVKTVAPQGVDLSKFGWLDSWSDSVNNAKAASQMLVPVHNQPTNYRYNTLNQVVAQQSPDGGKSEFWYDRLGRLVISRNAKQKAIDSVKSDFSYTKYDLLGRIIEVGEINNNNSQAMTDAFTRDASSLDSWLTTNQSYRKQITSTYYDIPYSGFAGLSGPLVARNLRNRVAYSTITIGNNPALYDQGSFFSYDIHGNVDTLLQDYKQGAMSDATQRFKKLVYKYDLISGKVNHVAYQPGQADQFYHRYTYDAENRLTAAETSLDSLIWEKEASYQYLFHGPLSRTILGQQKVQGIDYGYTLQGWLRVINGIQPGYNDIGMDGYIDGYGNPSGMDTKVAKDAYAVTLYYNSADYSPIYNWTTFVANPATFAADTVFRSLYNGNITAMSVHIPKLPAPTTMPSSLTPVMFYSYKYDQLNRITRMDLLGGFNNGGQSWDYINYFASADYKERVKYDANGNILKYLRNGSTIGGKRLSMDSLEYRYYAGTNQLRQVRDSVSGGNYSEDIDNQSDTSNYVYDPIGNLIRDKAEGIDSIKWNVYGKITNIYKNTGTKITYTYDASGNRISKKVASSTDTLTTWYVRDATGNVMSTYYLKEDTVKQDELHMYGSSRLGIVRPERFLTLSGQYGDTTGTISLLGTWRGRVFTRGKKFFELTNHLGNVLVTLTDRKQQIAKNDSVISYYEPDVATANDYYPFGMIMPGRKYSFGTSYRYGFNGKENDNEVKGEGDQQDYGMRIYDPRLGRFLSVDPLTKNYPSLSPYPYAMNRPIDGIDLDGGEWQWFLGPLLEKFVKGYVGIEPVNEKQLMSERSYQAAATSFKAVKFMIDCKTPMVNPDDYHSKFKSDQFLAMQSFVTNGMNANVESKNVQNQTKWSVNKWMDDFYSLSGLSQMPLLNLIGEIFSLKGASNKDKLEAIQGAIDQGRNAWSGISEAGLTFGSILLSYGGGVPEVKNLRVSLVMRTSVSGEKLSNLIPEGSLANHLFKGADKLVDNAGNRALIQKISNGKALGIDAYGKSWYVGVDEAGNSIYTYAQNGVVKGAGYAKMTAEEIIKKYGLK